MIRAALPLLALALAAPALAAGPEAASDRAAVALTAGWSRPDGGRTAGLTFRLAPGWKTYWRMPGDSGVAPAFDWSGSENLAAVEVLWPAPKAFDSFGMLTLGYGGEVTLPVVLTPEDPAAPVRLRLSLFYGVCADICVPETAELDLDIAPDAAAGEGPIRAALAALPAALDPAAVVRCTLAGAGDARRFEAVVALPEGAAPTVAVVEGPPDAWFMPPVLAVSAGRAEVSAPLGAGAPAWIDRAHLRLTLVGPEGALELVGCGH